MRFFSFGVSRCTSAVSPRATIAPFRVLHSATVGDEHLPRPAARFSLCRSRPRSICPFSSTIHHFAVTAQRTASFASAPSPDRSSAPMCSKAQAYIMWFDMSSRSRPCAQSHPSSNRVCTPVTRVWKGLDFMFRPRRTARFSHTYTHKGVNNYSVSLSFSSLS